MGTYGKETKIHMKGREEVMSESKAIVTNGWSAINTVDEFDNGLSNNSENIVTANDDISKKILKSLFVESLIDQLCKLLEKDPKKGHKLYEGICSKLYKMQLIEDTYNIEELASLRSHFQQALLDVMVKPDARLYSLPHIKLGSSRYATEYEEICFLDSGGFGQVFKAKNRLDQVIYAVKKISLRYQNVQTFARKLNEVKTLAKLNHPNIVQYKAAWLEPAFNMKPTITPVEVANLSTTDSDIVVFQSNSSNNQEKEPNKNLEVCKYQRGGNIGRPVPQVWALLYVSMQLCDETLSEWLYNRNSCREPLNVPLVLSIITQAVSGIVYIHSCNIVHHDIKPRNIFLSSDLKSVQVGDFGLSCCLQGHDHLHCPLEGGQFGTPLYAAPEQLKGRCDPKSDMFSLGLILIELFTMFSTEMERVKVLTEARSGHLPCSIPLPLIPIIRALISHNLDDRPTAAELLAELHKLRVTDFTEAKNTTTTAAGGTTIEVVGDVTVSSVPAGENVDKLLKDKDKEIVQLRQMLAQRENEIAELKHFLNRNST